MRRPHKQTSTTPACWLETAPTSNPRMIPRTTAKSCHRWIHIFFNFVYGSPLTPYMHGAKARKVPNPMDPAFILSQTVCIPICSIAHSPTCMLLVPQKAKRASERQQQHIIPFSFLEGIAVGCLPYRTISPIRKEIVQSRQSTQAQTPFCVHGGSRKRPLESWISFFGLRFC